jgi:hypothetical protein
MIGRSVRIQSKVVSFQRISTGLNKSFDLFWEQRVEVATARYSRQSNIQRQGDRYWKTRLLLGALWVRSCGY